MNTLMIKAVKRFNRTMSVCEDLNVLKINNDGTFESYECDDFKPKTIDDLIKETEYQISLYYEGGHCLNDLKYEDSKEWVRRVRMLNRLFDTLNAMKKEEENKKFYERLKNTIDVYFPIDEKINVVLDSEGNYLYYIRRYDWSFAPWDKKWNNFNWWQTITPKLVDELFDENNKLHDGLQLGYYDLFKEWAKGELKELGKKIDEETRQGKHPLSEETLKKLIG